MSNDTQLESIGETLCIFIRSHLVESGIPVHPATPLSELGLDSFSLIEIVLFVERRYGLALPDEALTFENLHSPDALARCIQGYLEKNL